MSYDSYNSVRTPGDTLDDCLRRACQYLGKPSSGYPVSLIPRDLSFACWIQEWEDKNMHGYTYSAPASLEHEGKYYEQTTIIFGPEGDAVVFFGTTFGYHIKEPNDRFWELFNQHKMLGTTQGWGQLEGKKMEPVTVVHPDVPSDEDWSMYGG